MDINYVVIHELEKESKKTGATLLLFDEALDKTNPKVIKLIKELNERYRHRSESYGVFDSDNPTAFHSEFEKYFNMQTEKSFIEFTKIVSDNLKIRVDAISQAKGGYLIFANYSQSRNFVGVFLVRNTTGISFKKDGSRKQFRLDDIQHIDFENLAMACRINLDGFKNKDIRYLSFISKKSDDMSLYFTRWISTVDTETNEADTDALYNVLSEITPPIDEETNQIMQREVFLEKAFLSIKSLPGKVVNLRDVSNALFGNPGHLTEYLNANDIIINGEFKAHPKTLRKFVHVRAKADEVELAFPHSAYKKIVRFDENDSSQIIIKSQDLADEIRATLKTNYP